VDYAARAELFVGSDEKSAGAGPFAQLVRYVMTKVPGSSRLTYTIMQGRDIYDLAQIEEIFRRPDFPPA